ncbi:hypothetical protein D3C80_1378310 [compost metagenome]
MVVPEIVDDALRGPVVGHKPHLFQANPTEGFKRRGGDGVAAERPINCLVRVADEEGRGAARTCPQDRRQYRILNFLGVLELVHEDTGEQGSEELADRRHGSDQLVGVE